MEPISQIASPSLSRQSSAVKKVESLNLQTKSLVENYLILIESCGGRKSYNSQLPSLGDTFVREMILPRIDTSCSLMNEIDTLSRSISDNSLKPKLDKAFKAASGVGFSLHQDLFIAEQYQLVVTDEELSRLISDDG